MHPSARLFLWTDHDVAALLSFIGKSQPAESVKKKEENDAS
jgi:hypothetical protein